MSVILADTSVWVEMLRKGGTPAVFAFGELLRQGLICTHGLVRAEVLSGALSARDYRRLGEGFSAVTTLADPPNLWDLVGRARYRLARQGFQASIADLVVATVASYHHRKLFTLDQDFGRIRKVLAFELFEPLPQ